MWGLSRETVLLSLPIRVMVMGGYGYPVVPGLIAFGIVRAIQGRADLYCERWSFFKYNISDLKACIEAEDTGPIMALLWVAATIAVVVWGRLPEPLASTWMFPLVWLGAGWLMGRAREVRIFLPCAIWIAATI